MNYTHNTNKSYFILLISFSSSFQLVLLPNTVKIVHKFSYIIVVCQRIDNRNKEGSNHEHDNIIPKDSNKWLLILFL